jgi:hypothetical protein
MALVDWAIGVCVLSIPLRKADELVVGITERETIVGVKNPLNIRGPSQSELIAQFIILHTSHML